MSPAEKNASAPSPSGMAITMADIAREAGVSAMTVSRALRDDSSIAEETRARIQSIVRDRGYVPDQSAGALSSRRSGFIAALIPSINNSNFSDTARGLTEILAKRDLQLMLAYTDYSIEREEQLIETLLRRRPEGIVVTGGRHTARARQLLISSGVPIIETWDLPEAPVDHVVGFSNASAARAMVTHLIERGYRNLGFIGGATSRDTRGADRRRGFLEAVEEFGLPRSRVVTFGNPPITVEQGGQAIVQMVETWRDVDAVMCVSDLSAFGAIMECQRRGWTVPGRVAIAGFGDFEIARACYPSITTVAVECVEIGRQAGQLLLDAIDARRAGKRLAPSTVMMDFRVIAREST